MVYLDLIHETAERGVVVVNVSQCVNGGVQDKRYMTGNVLANAGVISGHDLTSEAAITKLMYLFGMGLSTEQVKKYISISICGEITVL